MPTGYQIKNQTKPHYLTLQIVDWVDIFTRKDFRDIIVESLNFCIENKGLSVYGYVIMSNHVHLIAHHASENLSGIIRDIKSYTSKQMLQTIASGKESREKWMLDIFRKNALKHQRNSRYQIWTHENHAMEVYSSRFFENKLDYIHNNPIRAGWVSKPEDYLYSSAKIYAGEEGFVKVEPIIRKWKTIS